MLLCGIFQEGIRNTNMLAVINAAQYCADAHAHIGRRCLGAVCVTHTTDVNNCEMKCPRAFSAHNTPLLYV